jgi:RNA polymerase sigma-70 factor, ECF subfamily
LEVHFGPSRDTSRTNKDAAERQPTAQTLITLGLEYREITFGHGDQLDCGINRRAGLPVAQHLRASAGPFWDAAGLGIRHRRSCIALCQKFGASSEVFRRHPWRSKVVGGGCRTPVGICEVSSRQKPDHNQERKFSTKPFRDPRTSLTRQVRVESDVARMEYASLSPEELILACRQTDDIAAWEEFVHRFHRLIAMVALRVARRWGEPSPQQIDDLVQETYLKLCGDNFRMLRKFKSHHPGAFYGYLKVVTANLVHDHFKAAHSSKRGSGTIEIAADEKIPLGSALGAGSAVKSSERGILMREIDAALARVAAGPHLERDRKLFWLYYRVGLTADAIAGLPSIGLSTKGVESSLLRLTRLLREEVGRDRPKVGNGARAE